ncbi:O-fucosyltransferase 27 [Impatiens glandulifera]|uniref:O-fucosyltransferase 27 n=1 Tax=Impatiens glandulifera TaxID=253017 RepID=UPI001FB0A184|nr:O-fucosyltransferase 27 [Impatiens glandulifera]
MKAEGKMVFKSKLKWLGLLGLVLSAFSLFTHFLLAGYSEEGIYKYYQSSVTIFSWRPVFEDADLIRNSPLYRRLWGPVRRLENLYPFSNPRGRNYAAPISTTNGYLFVRIRGGFHEIRNSICDVVLVSRLLNATLVIPEILSTTSSKGISSEFKSFAYLYNEDEFMLALAKDIKVVKILPKDLKGARRKKNIPMFKVSPSTSPYFYLHQVLPVLNRHSVVELIVSDGGALQAILPSHQEEYQRLRCRVAFHALKLRPGIRDLASNVLNRLRNSGRPFIAYDPGMTRDALAYYGCAELFQDVHSELIQHRRAWMIKRGIVKGNLSVHSETIRLNGSCPLMPEEVGILLRAYGYSWDTVIYVAGGEVFGGQKKLIPLRGMFENVADRTSLSTVWEISKIYGRETNIVNKVQKSPPSVKEEMRLEAWKKAGHRPRPLPPPPARQKYPYNIEGWWGWVAESDNEPESTVMELRMNAHKLLWEAIDYYVCVEADVFIPGFDLDGKGRPNFASLVMGHRLYQHAELKTFRPNRKEAVKILDEIRDHLYEANHTWIRSVRRHLRASLYNGFKQEAARSKVLSFLSHPIPECSCSSKLDSSSAELGVTQLCPSYIGIDRISQSREMEKEEEIDEDDTASSSGLFFRFTGVGDGGGETVNKEEPIQIEDQEELEGADK